MKIEQAGAADSIKQRANLEPNGRYGHFCRASNRSRYHWQQRHQPHPLAYRRYHYLGWVRLAFHD
jgi:hypothetical protein